MAPTSSIEAPAAAFDAAQRTILLGTARASIEFGLAHGRPLNVHPAEYPEPLKALLASFVTLHEGGQLRGCIGHLEAYQPLIVDVAENAYAAAFRDPRFPPLEARELPALQIHVSVLSEPAPLNFTSEADLVAQLRPGVDGLILQDGRHRGTFLPSVWESLADPGDFLTHLKIKAGLAPNHWSDTLQVARYTTESFGSAEA
jgi:AmmeMemoRadiSam system protein A